MESRKIHGAPGTASGKFSDLPKDYVKMVNEVFATNFDAGLKALKEHVPGTSYFATTGRIYSDEVLLCISLMHEGQLAATTVYASADYDAQASAPTIQDVLALCVDGIGTIFGQILDPAHPEMLEAIAFESLSALESIPYEWAEIQIERSKIFLKVDKANPVLDQMTEDWLERHDPLRKAERSEEEKATEELFVTGPKRPGSDETH